MSEISGSIFRDDKSDKKREKKSDTSKEVSDNHVSYKEFMKIVKKTRIMPSSYENFPHFHEKPTEQQIGDIKVKKKKGLIDNKQTFDMYSGDISNDNTEESNKYVSYKEFLRRVKKIRVTPLSSEGFSNFGERSIEQPLNYIETSKKKVEIETKQTFDMHSGGINVDKAEESNKHISYEDFLRRVKKTRITPLSTESLPNFETKPQKHIIIDCIGAKKEVDNDNENILVFKSKNGEKSSEKIEDTSKKLDNKTKKKPIGDSDEKVKEQKLKVENEKKKDIQKSKEEIREENEGSKEINHEKDKSEEKTKSESFSVNNEKKELTSNKQKSQDIKREGVKTDKMQEKEKEEELIKLNKKLNLSEVHQENLGHYNDISTQTKGKNDEDILGPKKDLLKNYCGEKLKKNDLEDSSFNHKDYERFLTKYSTNLESNENEKIRETSENFLNVDSKNDQIKKIYENIRDFPTENKIRIKADQNDLYRVQNELKSLGYTIKDINQKIGVNFKGPLYRGYKMDQNSFKKLEALVGREIKKDLEVGYSPNFKRIQIDHKILKDVCDELNKIGYSNNKISKEIGTYIGNALYKDYSIDNLSFKKLKKLFGKEIPHETFKNKPKGLELMEKTPSIKEITYEQGEKKKVNISENSIELKESQKLAEFIGISLGDGHIPNNMENISISSNGKEEIEYIKYTKDLMENLLNKTPKIHPDKNSNNLDLVVYGKDIVGGLIKKGLIPGNKVKNQVSVPQWIKEKKKYQRRCLKGLTDTDGSIFIKKAQKSIRIGFQNHSRPLIENFKEMCESLDIKTGNVTSYLRADPERKKIFRTYDLSIAGKSGVSKFIDIIKPKKWEYRAETLGLTLISLRDPQKRKAIERELNKIYPDKRTHYTNEYKDLLKDLCEKQGYEVNRESVIKEIENALFNQNKRELSINGQKVIIRLKNDLEE